MKKFVFLVVAALLLLPGLARAESGKDLVENSEFYDGKLVTYRGEVIGLMVRGDFAWVNVFDGGYVVGVWCKAEDAKMVSFVGDYGHIGDSVLVSGVFHKACPEHGGDLDIHADDFVIMEIGERVERTPSLPLLVLSLFLFALAIFVMAWLWRVRREREKVHYLLED